MKKVSNELKKIAKLLSANEIEKSVFRGPDKYFLNYKIDAQTEKVLNQSKINEYKSKLKSAIQKDKSKLEELGKLEKYGDDDSFFIKKDLILAFMIVLKQDDNIKSELENLGFDVSMIVDKKT